MSGIPLGDLEIVGFIGVPAVECGRALPVVRRASDRAHAVLDLSDGATRVVWHSESEAESMPFGRWTRLQGGLLVPRACVDIPGRQPMVVFAEQSLLELAELTAQPESEADEYLIWRRLDPRDDNRWIAACASETTVESLLDKWARALLRRFGVMFATGHDREYLQRIADFALCAARNPELRWQSYCHYAVVQEPARVRSTFDIFVQSEFPEAAWDDFVKALQSLKDVFGSSPVIQTPPASPSTWPSTVMPKLQNIASEDADLEDEFFTGHE